MIRAAKCPLAGAARKSMRRRVVGCERLDRDQRKQLLRFGLFRRVESTGGEGKKDAPRIHDVKTSNERVAEEQAGGGRRRDCIERLRNSIDGDRGHRLTRNHEASVVSEQWQ